jgi:hypothetical protein
LDIRDKAAVIESLARMAAQLAGRDPDEQVRMRLAGAVVFEEVMWRYTDFLRRAEAAYEVLSAATPPDPVIE